MLVGAAVILLLRRPWPVAIACGLATGVCLGVVHDTAVRNSALPPGTGAVLCVEVTDSARVRDGAHGPWWMARGQVVAGGPRVRVSLTGDGEQALAVGDTVTAAMTVSPSQTPGEAARLRVRAPIAVAPADSFAAAVRSDMRRVAGDGDPGWLLSGMTLGLDEGLSEQAARDMRESGLSHLTAVSGANCAVLMLLVLWLCGWLRLGRRARVLVALAVLALFVAVVGSQPSILRASVMAGLALVAGVVGGRRAAAHVLQISVVVLLIVDPWLAYSVGFMLSIAATGGLITLISRGPLAATLAAQIATMPILLAIGGAVGLRTIAANVLVTPVAAAIPVVGLASLAAQPFGLSGVLAAMGRLLTGLVLFVAGLPIGGDLHWVSGWTGVALAAVVAMVILTHGRARLVLSSVVVIAAISLTARLAEPWPIRGWWLVACDVGQGDGFVVRSGGATLVVDTGPDPDLMAGCLDRLGVRRVDLLVISHFHADHVAGIGGVLRSRSVGQVWISPCQEPAEQFGLAATELVGIPYSVPTVGSVHALGDSRLHVVWPQRIINSGSVPNNASVTFRLDTPHATVLFLGDLEEEAQSAVLRTADVRADIVKVPHHGSAKFDQRLPGAVSARLALIGVGRDNSFGHPTAEAITAWQRAGAMVYTTADNGDIAVTTSGNVVVRGVTRSTGR